MKVLITELMWNDGIEELKKQGIEVDYHEELYKDREKLLEIVKYYDAMIVRNQTKVDQELLKAASHVKVIGRLGVGMDNIDIPQLKNKNIKLVYARNANATSVAEYVLSAMLTASRPLYLANVDTKKGNWNRKLFTGSELSGKTLGLIGLGEIAHRVAKRAASFGMKVIGYDPFVIDYDLIVSDTGVELERSLNELLSRSDFVSLHVPLTPDTKHLISDDELQMMKPAAYLINTSRGGIISENALLKALNNQTIAGAFLDVLEVEPISQDHPFLLCDNAFITPHISGLTDESQRRTSVLVAREVAKILKGKPSLMVL
ncbi:hydroxyacid dehydrogenase [Siminovitchia sediminis]|uniref:Hydroxyacid dehydrogenase n=1 Tax=Siminovitchia sediminis TaxID=1274353 RepID=A0ABW4KL56_9BACI